MFVATRLLSLVAVSGGHSLLQCGISRCGGFSRCGAQALGHADSVVVACELSCPAACGILPDQELNPCPPALAGGFLTTGPPLKSLVVVVVVFNLEIFNKNVFKFQ